MERGNRGDLSRRTMLAGGLGGLGALLAGCGEPGKGDADTWLAEAERPLLVPEGLRPARYEFQDHPLPAHLVPTGDEFLVAMLPDTQHYVRSWPRYMDWICQWLALHKDDHRIAFVSHVGDIVQSGQRRSEWDDVRAAYDRLDAVDMPYGLAPGNHDDHSVTLDPTCDDTVTDCALSHFLEYFGPQHHAADPWYRGTTPWGSSNYQVVEIEGLKLLFLHLRIDPLQRDVDWGAQVCADHPDHLVHLTTHRYMYDFRFTDLLPNPFPLLSGGRMDALFQAVRGTAGDPGLIGDELWDGLVRLHQNIFMVHCGHVDAEFLQTDDNDFGLPVHQCLIDYQNMIDGGGGWIRLLKFKPSANEVEAITYSPIQGRVRENRESFQHATDIVYDYGLREADTLEDLGIDEATFLALFEDVTVTRRDEYEASLYDAGARDSNFIMPVDFSAYVS